MPELPEVETIRKDLYARIIGKEIVDTIILHPKTVGGQPDFFASAIKGRRIIDIRRIGKALIFELSEKNLFLIAHLKMTGQFILCTGKGCVAGGHGASIAGLHMPGKHTRVYFIFKDGAELYFNDMRLFGYLKLVSKAQVEKFAAGFGPEPFDSTFNVDYLTRTIKGRRIAIKAVLLDQALVAGIGNIYADEILFEAGVRPDRPSSSLSPEEIRSLAIASPKILRQAILLRGTTFNDYRDPDGNKGGYLAMLKVYHRTGLPCLNCGKSEIRRSKTAGRGTHYCPICQK